MNTNPKAVRLLARLQEQLLAAEHILSTQYSFELAEPNYLECLELIGAMPEQRLKIINLITSMFLEGEISDEPVAYLMHHLRWPEVLDWAHGQLRSMQNPVAQGRPIEKILAAFSDSWENNEFYKSDAVAST